MSNDMLHILPCRIAYNGKSHISTYFHVKPIEETEHNVADHEIKKCKKVVSSLRGKSLYGNSCILADHDMIGKIISINEDIQMDDKKNIIELNKKLKLASTFEAITVFDLEPCYDNTFTEVPQWLYFNTFMNAVHK